jgi:hypothetical protein
MSDQNLIPFKAKFILSVKTTIKDFFENSNLVSLEDKYKPLVDNLGNVDIQSLIKYYQLSSQTYKDYKVFDFKFHQAFDVNPSNMVSDKDERDYALRFKLESFQIEVLQIAKDGKQITFSDSSNVVKTITLNEDLKLIKV